MKRYFLAALLSITFFSQAQESKKHIDPKYVFCYKNLSVSTDDYKIYIEDAINEDGVSKLKIRIFNKTNDYLIFKPEDVIFKIGSQNVACKEKQLIIMPNEEGWKVISVKGKGFQEEKYTLEIKNMHKISASIAPVKVEDMPLPPAKNEFYAGKFKFVIKKADLQTDKTILKCECTYEGDGVGILSPAKCIAIMPKKQENPNADKFKSCLLEKGKSENFLMEFREMKGAGDMQKGPMKLVWGETFKDSKVEPIKGTMINFELDGPKTAEKNQ
jgi:hypothetical protein